MHDIGLLKIGRHFRMGACKVVCARNESECGALRSRAADGDGLFEAADCMGPVVLLRGPADEAAQRLAAGVAAAYSDGDAAEVTVNAQMVGADAREWRVTRPSRETLNPYRIEPKRQPQADPRP